VRTAQADGPGSERGAEPDGDWTQTGLETGSGVAGADEALHGTGTGGKDQRRDRRKTGADRSRFGAAWED
jgi:hypothetical protein